MPKAGMPTLRRAALVDATIQEIGAKGSLDVTVGQIARRAGVSSALAHHYFGSKDQIFLAAMRHVLALYAAEVRGALAMAKTPRGRVEAVIRASFSDGNFRAEVISAWLNFYVLAQESESARRLLTIYQRRLQSNLLDGLRPLLGHEAPPLALGLAAMIDGLYIRQALRAAPPDPASAIELLIDYLDRHLPPGAPR